MKRLMLIVAGVAFLPICAETVTSIRGDDNGHSKLFEAAYDNTAQYEGPAAPHPLIPMMVGACGDKRT